MYWMMVILGVIFIGFVAYMLIRESKSVFAPPRKPDASTGYKPSVRADKPRTTSDTLLTFKGEGTGRTERFFLDCAIYRIEYQFPPDAKVKVELVSADGNSRKLLANKAGFDSSSFNVPVAKYYLLDVKPEAADTAWAIIIKPF